MNKVLKFIGGLFKDLLDQAWTLLGLALGWVLLEGSARDVVGQLIGVTLIVWVLTYPIRREKDEDKEED
jgi:hypothetical protein